MKNTYDNNTAARNLVNSILLRETVTYTAAAVVTATIVTAAVMIVFSPILLPLWLLEKAFNKVKSLLGK